MARPPRLRTSPRKGLSRLKRRAEGLKPKWAWLGLAGFPQFRSEDPYRKLVELALDAIIVRHEGVIEYVNSAGARMLGARGPEYLVGRTFLDFIHPDDRAESILRIKKTLEENWASPWRRHRMLTVDGETIHVESNGAAFDHRGRRLIQGIFRNIGDRLKAEEDLKRSEALFRQLADFAPFPVMISRADGRMEYLNPRFSELFGYTLAEVPDRTTFRKLIYPDPGYLAQVEAEIAARDKTFARDGFREVERRAVMRDGSPRSVTFYIIQLPDGRQLNFIQDVTDRKRAADEGERRARLEGAMEMARTACHELNQPLQVLVGQCELILWQTPEESEAHRRARVILEQATRLSQITDQIQGLTRYETKGYLGWTRIIDLEKSTT